jgi:hypothetical protein
MVKFTGFTGLFLCLIAAPGPITLSAAAQYISVVGSHVSDRAGTPIADGTICFLATDDLDAPVKVWPNHSTSTTPVVVPFCAAVAAGEIAQLQVADPTTTSPVNLLYRVTITNKVSGDTLVYRFVKVTGPTFHWDDYAPAASLSLQFTAYQFGSGMVSRCAGNLESCVTSGPEVQGSDVTGSAPQVPDIEPKGTVFADSYCARAGTYDQTCLGNAIAHVGSAYHVVLGPHEYDFTSPLKLSGVKDLSIEGSGPATIIRQDGISLRCTGCTDIKIENLTFRTVTAPVIVSAQQVPLLSPFTPVALDRWGNGEGYMPTINDQDLVSVADGGSCTSGSCLSRMQIAESFDTGVFFQNSQGIEVDGLSGSHFSIVFYDCASVHVHNNLISGGRQFGGILFWRAGVGNHNAVISNNVVQYSGFSGIMLGGGDHYWVLDNVVMNNGESGIKTYQGAPEQASFVTIIGNQSAGNWYDGFDLTSNNPRTSKFEAYSVASQNYAANNHGTGYIADGKFWNFSDNAASNNNLTGMALAFCNSAIIGNKAVGNNTALLTTGMHQISVSGDVACGDNLVLNNRTDTMGHPGSGIYAGGDGSTLISNAEATGADWIGPSNLSQSNSDGAGLLPATQYTASIVSAGN